jgi:hypothetical protein
VKNSVQERRTCSVLQLGCRTVAQVFKSDPQPVMKFPLSSSSGPTLRLSYPLRSLASASSQLRSLVPFFFATTTRLSSNPQRGNSVTWSSPGWPSATPPPSQYSPNLLGCRAACLAYCLESVSPWFMLPCWQRRIASRASSLAPRSVFLPESLVSCPLQLRWVSGN